MEQNFEVELAKVENKPEIGSETGIDKTKLILPGAILIAALLVSGSIVFYSLNTGKLGANIKQAENPTAGERVDVSAGDSPFLGNKDAKITLIEFADYRCPFCERFYKDAERQIIENYVNTGKAKFVFKNYAFLGQESVWTSEAAECANEQGKFWEYHDWLYNNQAPESDLAYYSKANLIKYAGKLGLDSNKFSSCLNSGKYAERVSADLSQGKAAGVTGTPTLFINGQSVVGAQPFSVFKAIIDEALK